jgi:heat shock protein HtpX
MKRIFLFLITNIAIMLVITIIINIFGLGKILDQNGIDIDLTQLLALSAVVGVTGSFISLAMSKTLAKQTTGAYVIKRPRNEEEQWLLATVERQATKAKISMPELAIYNAPDINAFATGMFRNNALIAVSTGLLNNMTREEAEAVLAHEVSHVANGDMVTLALIQGVINTFVFFLSRVIGHIIDRTVLKTERGHGPAYWVTTIIAQLVLGILASAIVMWFSRHREYQADAGAATLEGKNKMIHALERLLKSANQPHLPEQLEAFGISGGMADGLKSLFMSHPPLAKRIEALRNQPI